MDLVVPIELRSPSIPLHDCGRSEPSDSMEQMVYPSGLFLGFRTPFPSSWVAPYAPFSLQLANKCLAVMAEAAKSNCDGALTFSPSIKGGRKRHDMHTWSGPERRRPNPLGLPSSRFCPDVSDPATKMERLFVFASSQGIGSVLVLSGRALRVIDCLFLGY
jgi:hypothetical protein